jgi:endonuclease-8
VPEGDTIHRAARLLGGALTGQVILRYWAYRPQLLAPRRDGHTVIQVEARGKNLLIHFDDQRALYSHMKMTGAWHVYAPGEAWRRPEAHARVIIEVEAWARTSWPTRWTWPACWPASPSTPSARWGTR